METVDHGESKPLSTELLFEEMGQYCQKSGVSNRRLEDSDDVVSDDTFSDMPPGLEEDSSIERRLSHIYIYIYILYIYIYVCTVYKHTYTL